MEWVHVKNLHCLKTAICVSGLACWLGFCLMGLALFFVPGPVSALSGQGGPPIVLNQAVDKIDLTDKSQILIDESALLELAQVSDPALGDGFVNHGKQNFNFNNPKAAYWIRFKLSTRESASPAVWVLEVGKYFSHFFDQVDLYIPKAGTKEEYSVSKAGSGRPFAVDGYRNRSIYLKIPADFNREQFFYLRLRARVAMSEPMTLWQVERLWATSLPHLLIPVFAYGVLLAMVLYNLFILLILRDRVYLYYTLFVSSTFLWQIFAQGYVYIFFDLPPGLYQPLDYLLAPLSGIMGILMARAVLDSNQWTPKVDRVFLLSVFGWALTGMLVLTGRFDLSNLLGNCIGLGIMPFVVWATLVRIRQGYMPARFLVPAWVFFILGMVIYLSQNLNFIPTNLWTSNATLFGSVLEAVFLSFALADRIKVLRKEKEDLVISELRYKNLSMIDGLTGLYIRRYFDEKLKKELHLSRQMGKPLALIVMDVDNFKLVNDTHGHPQGDKVLRKLADIIRTNLRETDVACRYGGEEFVVILPSATDDIARQVAERILNLFGQCRFKSTPTFNCTISMGLALLQERDKGPGDLFQRADGALYQAKTQGKNRVVEA